MNKGITILIILVVAMVTQIVASSSWAEHFNDNKTTVRIEGKIVDNLTGESLTGVAIYVDGDFAGYSDFDGNYFINDLPAGNHEITTSLISYKDVKEKISLNHSEKMDIQLNIIE